MSSFMTVVWIAMICAIAATAGWMFTPRGKNQALIRSSIALTITCCYLMWAITFLAQLHPLIQPHKTGLRWEN
ncbi:ATPase, V0 complex, subunit E1/e2 [Dioszegia hungarica]|uniref:ATPase, V0 complex, subunit E1/e2 n=1 Tax=Dioszegia hungarica TaxID=4972 RepID=A0AA38HHH0_9TREE|nr:ATPase, V0 complex, subunit E1/e2 [Dioszegia hungarica]KAI9639279.1 ATPase, V0 complex, subunit E1/e2 [Dioszegia hungarica]